MLKIKDLRQYYKSGKSKKIKFKKKLNYIKLKNNQL